jgi:hypothetical protein
MAFPYGFNVRPVPREGAKRTLAYSELFVFILVDPEFQWKTTVEANY